MNRTKNTRLTTAIYLNLMMTSARFVETSVTTTDNTPSQGCTDPDDQTILLHDHCKSAAIKHQNEL